MGGVAALVPAVGVGASVPPAVSDAALIAASARFVEANHAFCAVLSAEVDDDNPGRAAWEGQEAIASDATDVAVDAVLALRGAA